MGSPVFLLPDDSSYPIVEFDLTLSESHTFSAEVTDHPVEVGTNVADHIRPDPKMLSVEVYVTNTPIVETGGGRAGELSNLELDVPKFEPPIEPTIGSAFRLAGKAVGAVVDAITGGPPAIKSQLLTFPEVFDRVKEIHDILKDLHERGVTSTVLTSTQEYTSMALVAVGYPKKEAGGAAFTLDFKQVRTVTSETVSAPKPLEPRGAPKASKGAQSKKPVNGKDAPKAASLAFQALKALGVID